MLKYLKINEVNSNLIFLFPITSGLFVRDYLYFALASFTLFASFIFHIYKNKQPQGLHVTKLRFADRAFALLSYFYMFYFVWRHPSHNQVLFYSLLVVTLVLYFLGKTQFGKKYQIHTHFHIAIVLVGGTIPLFSFL